MRFIFDFLMFMAGLALGVFLFESTMLGVIAGAILAGATESVMGGRSAQKG